MRKIIYLLICILIIGISYTYCAPVAEDSFSIGMNPIINGLIYNGGFCFVIYRLAQKGRLIEMNDKSGNRLAYFPYLSVFVYGGIAFFSLIAIIWSKQFHLSFTIVPVFFSIESVIYVNRVMEEQKNYHDKT